MLDETRNWLSTATTSAPNSVPTGVPAAEPPILAELATPAPPRRRSPRWFLFAVGLLLAVAATLAIVSLLPRELQQWRVAAAANQRLDGDLPGAIQRIEQEIQRSPRDLGLRQQLVQWLMEDQQYQRALVEVDRLLVWQSTNPTLRMSRAEILQHLGQHPQAVEEWKKIFDSDMATDNQFRATTLNGLAYARSLANINLDEGLKEVDEAMRLVGENYAMLDTRGFLYFRRGDLDRALIDLNKAVEAAESDYRGHLTGAYLGAHRKQKAREDRRQAQSLAVICYHRALIHDARGDKQRGDQDRNRVRELGFEPNDALF